MKKNMELKTPRLIIDSWCEDDVEDLYEFASVQGVGEMAGWKSHRSLEESKKVIAWFVSDERIYAIRERRTHKAIGAIGFHRPPKEVKEHRQGLRGVEFGFILSKTYWGQGLMPEALYKVIDYLSKEERVDYFVCSHFTNNFQSKRVIEKLNFQLLTTSTIADGENRDREVLIYILDKK